MLRCLVLVAVVCAASGATMEQRQTRYHPAAEDRDGAHHGGGGGGGGGHGERGASSHHSSGGGGSSYSAPAHSPAAAAPAASYSAGGGGGGGSDQGNLYYYYYPVDEYGNTEASDAGFDIFTAIILPLVILGGLLLALSSFTFTFTGRAMRDNAEPGIVDQLQGEVERIFYIYLNAFESEACIQRAVCQTGVYASTTKNKDFYFSLVEPFIPETMRGNMAIFKTAAKDGFDMGKCTKYRCTAPKIFN
ncbi:uncharacterized protein LOC108679376 [Hyalella azteca]|uniref:Uncharacterized protein LOC108679376 n=1 Tax=Hyalella azteca TaxID=294128 RepID=A0A8B7PBF0_HYAAZ|nr:uncharacterized protein LOC108679376 [Hyalella azteca]